MTNPIRVHVIGTTTEMTIEQEQYDAQPDAFKKLDKPAEFTPGDPIPPKHKTTVDAEAAKKSPAKTTDDKLNT